MSPGSMPSWPRSVRVRHVLPYHRRRRPRRAAGDRVRTPCEIGFGAAELPVATVHSVQGALHRWATVRWSWLRPRAVPGLVALMALVGLLAITKHLAGLATHGEPIATAPVIVQISAAP